MKIRLVSCHILYLLFVFSFCVPLMALTEKEAHDAYHVADHEYDVAKAGSDKDYRTYTKADRVRLAISDMKSIAEYASADNTEELIDGLIDSLDAIGIDEVKEKIS